MGQGHTPFGPGHVLYGVPVPLLELLSELDDMDLGHEPLADCSDCVLLPNRFVGPEGDLGAAEHDPHPWAFDADGRCCTYHPRLPNYAVGQALAHGGDAARVMNARLAEPSGINAHGIAPSTDHEAARTASTLGFGRDLALRCPYWVGGKLACGIFAQRNAVCRTWFCKHANGIYASVRWNAVRKALTRAEGLVAAHLVRMGQPPDPGDAPDGVVDVRAWRKWFLWCADAVHRISARELAATASGDSKLVDLRARLAVSAHMDRPAPLEVVVPVLRGSHLYQGKLWVYGYSSHDCAGFEPSLIDFFAHLDGRTPWPVALRESEWPGSARDIGELMRIDVLHSPRRVIERAVNLSMALPPADPDGPMPDYLIAALRSPIAVGDKVWLQAAVPLGSVVAPRSVFALLTQLGGNVTWRTALERLPENQRAGVDEALVRRLYAIGALQPQAPEQAPAQSPGA